MHTILEAVRRGPHPAVLPRQAIGATAGVDVAPIVEPGVAMPISLVWPAGIRRTAAMRAFRTSLLRVEGPDVPPPG